METIGGMPVLLLFIFRFVELLLSGHQAVAIENAGATNANLRISTETEAPAADNLGPRVLDDSPQSVLRAASPNLRSG
jgi:hypothetical protein